MLTSQSSYWCPYSEQRGHGWPSSLSSTRIGLRLDPGWFSTGRVFDSGRWRSGGVSVRAAASWSRIRTDRSDLDAEEDREGDPVYDGGSEGDLELLWYGC